MRETKEGTKGGGRHASASERANVCVPCGGALFTRQLMSSETRRKLWTSRTAGTGCSFTETASGSAVERELLPNGSGEKMERGVKMSDVILNTRGASRHRRDSAAVTIALLRITKMLILRSSTQRAAPKWPLKREAPWIRNRDVPQHVRRTGVLSIKIVNAKRTFY